MNASLEGSSQLDSAMWGDLSRHNAQGLATKQGKYPRDSLFLATFCPIEREAGLQCPTSAKPPQNPELWDGASPDAPEPLTYVGGLLAVICTNTS